MVSDDQRQMVPSHSVNLSRDRVRFFGYAGTPLLLAVPVLFFSINSIVRSLKTSRHIQRSRSEEHENQRIDSFPRLPWRFYSRRVMPKIAPSPCPSSMKATPSGHELDSPGR